MEVGELAVSLTNESWEHRCGGVVERAFGVVVAGVDGSVTDARHFRLCLSRKALCALDAGTRGTDLPRPRPPRASPPSPTARPA